MEGSVPQLDPVEISKTPLKSLDAFSALFLISLKILCVISVSVMAVGILENEKELNNLGIFQENENAIKIIEWPSLIKIHKSDKLEIHLDYAKHDNERKLKLLGTGKWKNFNEL